MKKLLFVFACVLLAVQPAEAGIGKKLKRATKYGIAVAIIPARLLEGVWVGIGHGVNEIKNDLFLASEAYEEALRYDRERVKQWCQILERHLVPAEEKRTPVDGTVL